MNVDDIMQELYLDGVSISNLPNARKWYKYDTVPVSQDLRLVAIKGINIEGGGLNSLFIGFLFLLFKFYGLVKNSRVRNHFFFFFQNHSLLLLPSLHIDTSTAAKNN